MTATILTAYSSRLDSIIISEIGGLTGQWPTIVRVVLTVTAVILALTLVILLYVLGLRLWNSVRENYRRRFKQAWRQTIFEWMAGKPGTPVVLGRRDQFLLLELWTSLRRLIDDGSAAELNAFAAAYGLDELAVDILQYRGYGAYEKRVWMQLLAVQAARFIQTPRAMEALVRASESRNFRVNIAATCALVELGHEQSELSVLSTMMQFQQWVPAIVMRVGQAGGAGILHLVGEQLDSMDTEQARNLITLIGASSDRSLLPMLVDLLDQTTDVQEQASILRTLGRLGDHSHVKYVQPYLNDPDPVLRLRAVVAMGELGDEHDLREILPLSRDANWWIRYRAAESYLRIARLPPKLFTRFLASQDNPLAQQMFNHVYTEMRYA